MINGWINLYKPSGISSALALNILKKNLPKKTKIGHAGTLDPLAEGVLPVAIGEATKTVSFIMSAEKEYEFIISWGKSTDSYDKEGKVIKESEYIPTSEEIISNIKNKIGIIAQRPPIYSAIKINGQRACDLARKGIEAEIKTRNITIYSYELLSHSIKEKESRFRVKCGKGTYIRSLANDLADELSTAGHIIYLKRTQVGNFLEKNTILLAKTKESDYASRLNEGILPVDYVLDDIPAIEISLDEMIKIRNGQKITYNNYSSDIEISRLYSSSKLIAFARVENKLIKPVRIFNI